MKRKASVDHGKSGGDSGHKKVKPLTAVNPFTFTGQTTSDLGKPRTPPVKTGKAFSDAIIRMRNGDSDESVRTKVAVNLQGATGNASVHKIGASFSVMTHSTTELTQGMMNSSAPSAYLSTPKAIKKTKDAQKNKDAEKKRQQKIVTNSVLPVNLSLERATLESRVIKQLSPVHEGDAPYDASAKVSAFPSLGLSTKATAKSSPLGGIAIGSFLEDVTAGRAVGMDHIGSAMRAKTMAAKWQMKLAGNEDAGKGFQSTMLSQFPQLGKGGLEVGKLKDTGISALKSHWKSGGTEFSKSDQLGHISNAHKEAYEAGLATFSHKFDQMTDPNFKGGTWWTSKKAKIDKIMAHHKSGDEKRQEKAQRQYQKLSATYLQRKMVRHGIKSD
ncbi:MAG: hypothetical protein JNM11_02015 [Chitinimonas sp.]|nr:hypothetical protein [Chitinimonas sp.]